MNRRPGEPAPSTGTVGRPRCYVIAAIDLSHNGEFVTAKKLVDVAVDSGCDAVKFQRRSIDAIAVDSVLQRQLLKYPEFGTTHREVFKRLEFGHEEYVALRAHCAGRIDMLVAPFDLESLASSKALEVDGFKVDPPCATDYPLLEALGQESKPIVASVAMCSAREIAELCRVLRGRELILLYGVYAEPAAADALNFAALSWLGRFGCAVGFADTTDSGVMGPVAAALGAVVVERRITLNRAARGFGHSTSIEPEELRRYVQEIRWVDRALGKPPELAVAPCEASAFDEERKSVVAALDIPAGTALTREMLTCKAPLRGLTPSLISYLVGRRTVYDLKRDDAITFGMLE